MSTYFQPLRRKFGVVTLLTACLFAAGWVRSGARSEQLSIWVAKYSVVTVVSESSVLALSLWWWKERAFVAPATMIDFQSNPRPSHPGEAFYPEVFTWGFRYQNYAGGGGVVGCSIPYSAIVVPLTLLSAWLLLSKPRVAKPKADSLS